MVRLFATTSTDDPLLEIVTSLQRHPLIDVVGIGTTGRDTVEAIRRNEVDTLVFSLALADVARAVRMSGHVPFGGSPTLVVASDSESHPFRMTSLAYGFDSVLPIADGPDAAAARLIEISQGRHRLRDSASDDAPEPGLLARVLVTHDPVDREIADLVGSGLGDDEIARVTGRSIQDVRNRIEAIIHVNDLSTRTHLAVMRAAQIVVPDLS